MYLIRYNDRAHLEPREFEDHDGGPWAEQPKEQPKFQAVAQKWVVAPALGSAAPALAVFPRRLSNNISFAPDVHLSFSAVWTPIVRNARLESRPHPTGIVIDGHDLF